MVKHTFFRSSWILFNQKLIQVSNFRGGKKNTNKEDIKGKVNINLGSETKKEKDF